jgi:nucleotide-binding universal stress UspA family protein
MGYKTILVHCDTGRGTAARLKVALDLADRFDAHVIGLHVRQAFQAPAFTDAGPAMDSLYRSYETAVKADEAIAEGVFRETVGKGYSSAWRVADGYVDQILVAQARYADLVGRPSRADSSGSLHTIQPGGNCHDGGRTSGADRAAYRRCKAAGQDGDAVLERQPRGHAGGHRGVAAA